MEYFGDIEPPPADLRMTRIRRLLLLIGFITIICIEIICVIKVSHI